MGQTYRILLTASFVQQLNGTGGHGDLGYATRIITAGGGVDAVRRLC